MVKRPEEMLWLVLADKLGKGELRTIAKDVPDGEVGVIGDANMSEPTAQGVASEVGVVGARHGEGVNSFWVVVQI